MPETATQLEQRYVPDDGEKARLLTLDHLDGAALWKFFSQPCLPAICAVRCLDARTTHPCVRRNPLMRNAIIVRATALLPLLAYVFCTSFRRK